MTWIRIRIKIKWILSTDPYTLNCIPVLSTVSLYFKLYPFTMNCILVFYEEEINEDGVSENDIVYDDKTVFYEEGMNEDGESGNDIVYDDKTVAALLDRSQEGIEEKESWANEYLSSFKVIL